MEDDLAGIKRDADRARDMMMRARRSPDGIAGYLSDAAWEFDWQCAMTEYYHHLDRLLPKWLN